MSEEDDSLYETSVDLSTEVKVSFARIDASEDFTEIAYQLRAAAEHFERAAEHMDGGNVPRAAAHALAGDGHMEKAHRRYRERVIDHSENAGLE